MRAQGLKGDPQDFFGAVAPAAKMDVSLPNTKAANSSSPAVEPINSAKDAAGKVVLSLAACVVVYEVADRELEHFHQRLLLHPL